MKKDIRVVDKKNNIVRITTADERWYVKDGVNKVTKLPEYKFYRNATWIAGCYPKGVHFYKWLASKGWDESQVIMEDAGERGTMIHAAIEMLLKGETVNIDTKIFNTVTEKERELTVDEYAATMSFQDWFNEIKPEVLEIEQVYFNEEHNYAGTLDLICKIDEVLYIVDFKSGQNIFPNHEIQLNLYAMAYAEKHKALPELALLRVGYQKNKRLFKFDDISNNQFKLCEASMEIWDKEYSKVEPKQRDYPMSLKLNLKEKNGKSAD